MMRSGDMSIMDRPIEEILLVGGLSTILDVYVMQDLLESSKNILYVSNNSKEICVDNNATIYQVII